MNYDEEETRVSGLLPEFGAIFMSNRATKRECFKQKLFGLPSRHAHFVKYVRAGMILFLFEYERRELYGVFQACTDGAVNIVPNAYSSSGQLFPAQVPTVHNSFFAYGRLFLYLGYSFLNCDRN